MNKKPISVIWAAALLGGCLLSRAVVVSATEGVGTEGGGNVPSQQAFAVKLARALGHEVDEEGRSAIELLSRLSIIPGYGPTAQWEPNAPASTKMVAEVQASVQLLLKRVATGLAISPPPTLDLFVFQLPPGPQKIFFPTDDQSAPAKPPSDAGVTGGLPPEAPPPVGQPRFPLPPMVAAPPPVPSATPGGGPMPPPPMLPPPPPPGAK